MLNVRLFAPDYRGKYPHMFPLDNEVWERFLEKHSKEYKFFAYDVRCGKSVDCFPYWKEEYKRDAKVLSKLRIDAVGFKDSGIDIIEVKPTAGPSVIGQVLTYTRHFLADYKPSLPVTPVVVAGSINRNIISEMIDQGIKFIVV